eukprot:6194411-Pleurochrysis_carterae.AAC.2
MEHNSDKESRLKPESNLQARKRASAGAHRTSRRSHGLYVERPVGDVLAKGVAREVLGALRNGLAPRLRRAEVHRPAWQPQNGFIVPGLEYPRIESPACSTGQNSKYFWQKRRQDYAEMS